LTLVALPSRLRLGDLVRYKGESTTIGLDVVDYPGTSLAGNWGSQFARTTVSHDHIVPLDYFRPVTYLSIHEEPLSSLSGQ
jgi:hypothetical protein